MQTRWLGFADQLAISRDAAGEIWCQLEVAYGENGRFYHTLTHIQHVLDIAEQLQESAADFTAVQLAIWFHDVVYNPRRSDNEAQSAALAQTLLRPLSMPAQTLTTVANLILATQTHETAVTDPNTFVMLDADLAIFCASPKQYDAYAQAIRQEYSFVPEEAYRAGRTAVLERFLARSPFYFTEGMQMMGETAVRQNITRELTRLNG